MTAMLQRKNERALPHEVTRCSVRPMIQKRTLQSPVYGLAQTRMVPR